MFIKVKNYILLLLNDVKNFIYQKIKYNKNYLYFSNLEDIEKHKKNFYADQIKNRNIQKIKNSFPIELNKICFDNSLNLNDPVNPLVLTVNELSINPNINLENTSLYKFFIKFRPKNLNEAFFMNENNSRYKSLSQFTLFYPWFHKFPQRFLVPGMFGPKDISFPESRFIRLKNLIYLFKKYGFRPNEQDQISGYQLISDQDYRFVITAGAHRVSVLKSLYDEKFKFVDVCHDNLRVKNNYFKIRIHEINNWPAVKSGYIDKDEAERIFLNFFKMKKLNIYEA